MRLTAIGQVVATGRTSDVYAYGEGSVVKVPRVGVPAHWASMEASFTAAVRALGVPAPDVRGLVDVDGRESIVFEHIVGPSMWDEMLARPADVPALTRELAEVHRRILGAGPPEGVAGLVARMSSKIREVARLTADERLEALQLVEATPRGAALLHGDLHPGNVLLTTTGPIVIDWFDAVIGHPVADVVRASLLLRPPDGGWDRSHLPGAGPEVLRRIHDGYVSAMADVLAVPDDVLRRWESLVAVSRLAEGAQADEELLVALWAGRHGNEPSPLVSALSSARVDDQGSE